MRRWALLTNLLFFLAIVFLSVPTLFIGLGEAMDLESIIVLTAYASPLVLIQAALLLVPVAIARERPVRRRRVAVSAVFCAVPMGLIAVGILWNLLLILFGENWVGWNWDWTSVAILAVPILSWIGWGTFFYRSYASDSPDGFAQTMSRWLLRGSILELLIAIPSHIISRQRDECCAPAMTMISIGAGLAVAMMAFGPGLYFAFLKRIRNKKIASAGREVASTATP